ncbi:bifunctional folylpolyglutamate synthase/dihydrofolate synthase [Cellulomonas fimi]|uniref:Dihydrofolate synthase/folylpolyglutamate synthase n=1 Tax=Cellulomonas fimi (strain ATCC 484 / DSM 20113 / JCM 1341 / CCUG 24087 / LMG 16345 / NBRC 15513 / NCIMB 8980 / NCTC 7547 / NRS-133) TaxID=590998 RepID=F4H6I6_CELFA|nr:folylpolyglutamate synthase/dihydrofolate synthase family protein [Cellulomonas fimi]AEE45619.1 FolC bifunctional protein [Cellulomonas fimi ATCC 484]NNH05874.1 bifunctional folylpolyglutamate synthase/dihydrofolate synthase [Cellulomonas fimi]VEH30090.1 Folylpolyglutamate synthase [Cellulomonas fimi]
MSRRGRDGGSEHLRAEQARAAREAADEVYRAILARAPEHEIDPSFERTRQVMELLGDPQRAYRVVHLTGTNGKTSTARMVERLLREHGLRTGRFTSPHLTRVNERIVVDGEPISDERFVEVWQDVAPYVHLVDQRARDEGKPQLSFFEVFTVMAFAAFADAPVDVAVVEVGMGGLWDSTNVADGEVAVITPVAMDHERYLGDTLAEIASVKAGIVKEGATLVLAQQDEVVEGVVLAAAAEKGARVVREGVDIDVVERQVAVGGQLLTLRGLGGVYADVFLPLHGEFQAHNALLALVAAEAFLTGGAALDGDVVGTAFADVSSPGRLEVVRSSPTVLVDGAHNPAGVEALVAALDEAFAFQRVVGVVGVMADKDPEGILALLEPVLAEVVVTRASNPRALDPQDLAEVAVDVFGEDRVHVVERLDEAIDLAAARAEGEVERGGAVLVTGSILLVAEARILLGRP